MMTSDLISDLFSHPEFKSKLIDLLNSYVAESMSKAVAEIPAAPPTEVAAPEDENEGTCTAPT